MELLQQVFLADTVECFAGAACFQNGSFVPKVIGSEWKVSGGMYLLVGCPAGYQLVNSTDGTSSGSFVQDNQFCKPCSSGQYIINQNKDTCQACPAGTFLSVDMVGHDSIRKFKSLSSRDFSQVPYARTDPHFFRRSQAVFGLHKEQNTSYNHVLQDMNGLHRSASCVQPSPTARVALQVVSLVLGVSLPAPARRPRNPAIRPFSLSSQSIFLC